jgi:hypothetical protein
MRRRPLLEHLRDDPATRSGERGPEDEVVDRVERDFLPSESWARNPLAEDERAGHNDVDLAGRWNIGSLPTREGGV